MNGSGIPSYSHHSGEEQVNKLLLFARKSNQLPVEQKRKFLDSHPAKQLALPKNVDCSGFGHGYDAPSSTDSSTFLSKTSEQVLLTHMQKNVGVYRDSMMSSRVEEACQFLAEQSRQIALKDDSRRLKPFLKAVVDSIYLEIFSYKTHLNQVTAGSGLYISHTEPEEVTEAVGSSKGLSDNSVTYLRARFSTGSLSLVLRARSDILEFFLIPAMYVMSLSQIEDQYPSLVAMQIRCRDNALEWRILGDRAKVSSIQDFAFWVFDRYLEQAKVELEESTVSSVAPNSCRAV